MNFNDSIFKNLCVVSAPSGAGKTSLIKKYLHIRIYQSVFQRLQEILGKGKWMELTTYL